MYYPTPKGGASLILSFRLQDRITLILGLGSLAASRAFSALEADSEVIVIGKGGLSAACAELRWRAEQGQLAILDSDTLPCSRGSEIDNREANAFECYLLDNSSTTTSKISLVCITDTLLSTEPPNQRRSHHSAAQIYRICRARNIPVNVTDMPDLCDFTFTSTHRFESCSESSGGGQQQQRQRTPLQVGVTTNGQGCRLAGRIRREIVARLPPEAGAAVETVGKLRDLVKNSNNNNNNDCHDGEGVLLLLPEDEMNEDNGLSTPNRPVSSRNNNNNNSSETALDQVKRRMKWVAQVSEYWPLQKLAKMNDQEMEEILSGDDGLVSTAAASDDVSPPPISTTPHTSMHTLTLSHPKTTATTTTGKILLVGSGPGHPSLLTRATHTALTERAQIVLSDKLVPAAVLAVIPAHVEVHIARKFPGNADGAQNELMEAAVEAAKRGLTVVRLKQGDPVVYGRAGEEVLYFRSHGFEPIIIPGVSSALAAPIFAGIPVTQRGVAESFIVCTGVGRQGKGVQLPGYQRSRTLVVLMGVARLKQVINTLVMTGEEDEPAARDGQPYPPYLPIALIERATMSDQRVVSSTLRDIVAALESVGEQRPPGLLVIGWAVLALWGRKGDTSVLEDGAEGEDEERVKKWLKSDGGQVDMAWRVKEGLECGWADL